MGMLATVINALAISDEGYKIILKEVLSEKRYVHSLNVADTAAKLAIINDAKMVRSRCAAVNKHRDKHQHEQKPDDNFIFLHAHLFL